MWAVVPIVIMPLAVVRGRPIPMMMAWAGVILMVCLAPIGVWLFDRALGARAQRHPETGAGRR
jgi:hypothetical protein